MSDSRMFRAAVGGREGSYYGYGSWIESWGGDIYLDTTVALLDDGATDAMCDTWIDVARDQADKMNEAWEADE